MTGIASTRSYHVEAHSAAGGQAVVLAKQDRIDVDASAGQGDGLPGPAELLAAAFAACLLKNVERFSHVLPFAYRSAAIHVDADRQDTPPRMSAIHYRLTVVTDEPVQRVELLHRNIRRFGTVFNTLAAACEVSGELIAEPIHADGTSD